MSLGAKLRTGQLFSTPQETLDALTAPLVKAAEAELEKAKETIKAGIVEGFVLVGLAALGVVGLIAVVRRRGEA